MRNWVLIDTEMTTQWINLDHVFQIVTYELEGFPTTRLVFNSQIDGVYNFVEFSGDESRQVHKRLYEILQPERRGQDE